VRTIGGERLETEEVAVILGVETHLDFHVGLWAWTIWGQAPGQAPGRVERANDREGLAEAPPLSTGRRISALCKVVRWGVEGTSAATGPYVLARHLKAQGIEVLWRWSAPRAQAAKLAPYPQEDRLLRGRSRRTSALLGRRNVGGVSKSGDDGQHVEMIRALRARPAVPPLRPGRAGC
jgi:hypothetical protein